MIRINENFVFLINLLLIVFIVIMFYAGWKKGFIRSVLDLIDDVVSAWIAWLLCPIAGDMLMIWPQSWNPLASTGMAIASRDFLNQVLWFFIFFVLMRILFVVLDQVVIKVQEVGGIKQVSQILGGLMGIVASAFWICILSVVLSLPVFANGSEIVQDSAIHLVTEGVEMILPEGFTQLTDVQSFNTLFDNARNLSNEERQAIRQWLLEHGYDTDRFDEMNFSGYSLTETEL